jgi:hypothetical protein
MRRTAPTTHSEPVNQAFFRKKVIGALVLAFHSSRHIAQVLMKKKCTYRITFHNQGKVYEIYARQVNQGGLLGFIEVEEIIFGEKSTVVVDPSEESLKSEFAGVSRTYLPMHSVIRIDVVEKLGNCKITEVTHRGEKVTPFPIFTNGPDLSRP